MTKDVLQTRCKESAVGPLDALRDGDHAIVIPCQSALDSCQEAPLVERHLWQQQDVWGVTVPFCGERAGGCRPAGMAPHHFKCEPLGRGTAHGFEIERRLTNRGGKIFCRRAESR